MARNFDICFSLLVTIIKDINVAVLIGSFWLDRVAWVVGKTHSVRGVGCGIIGHFVTVSGVG